MLKIKNFIREIRVCQNCLRIKKILNLFNLSNRIRIKEIIIGKSSHIGPPL